MRLFLCYIFEWGFSSSGVLNNLLYMTMLNGVLWEVLIQLIIFNFLFSFFSYPTICLSEYFNLTIFSFFYWT